MVAGTSADGWGVGYGERLDMENHRTIGASGQVIAEAISH